MPTIAGIKYHLGEAYRQTVHQARIRTLHLINQLPSRPTVELGGHVSFRAKLEGVKKKMLIRRGAAVREQAWLYCMDANSSIEIGERTLIMPYAKLVAAFNGFIKIGRNCTIHSFDVLYGYAGGLTIEDDVRIGVNTMFISGNHAFDDPTRGPNEQGSTSEGIRIGAGSWIGAGAIILDGVTLPPKSIVGAGAVVTKSSPERCVLAGVPARPIRTFPSSH